MVPRNKRRFDANVVLFGRPPPVPSPKVPVNRTAPGASAKPFLEDTPFILPLSCICVRPHPSADLLRLQCCIYNDSVSCAVPERATAIHICCRIAKYPNPAAPGVPGHGRNWALGAAAYIACWAIWIFVVFIVYELIYSFVRRWRVSKYYGVDLYCHDAASLTTLYSPERPLMYPIYLSSPAFNFVAMTSYTNFCFLHHIRISAFSGEHGSLRDGLAETAYYYSQNWPTVVLLVPRAALSLALLLAFWTPQPGALALIDAGISQRDGTFFRASDGTLTNYARGVLIANAAWTAWRMLVVLLSLYVSSMLLLPWHTRTLRVLVADQLFPTQGWPLDLQRARLCRSVRATIPLGRG